jgi:phage tail sheath protein FI
MATYQSPGVYVQELPGPQLITAASTSNTAFVGLATQGPTDQPVLITSWNAFVQTFGGFAMGMQMPFSVYAFFSQGGAICYVTRATQAGVETATWADGSLTLNAASGGAWGDQVSVSVYDYPSSPAGGSPSQIFGISVTYTLPAAGQPLSVMDQLVQIYAASNNIPIVNTGGVLTVQVEQFNGFSPNDLGKPNGDVTQPSPLETRINSSSIFIRAVVTDALKTRPANAPATALSGGAGDPVSTPMDLATALSALDPIDNISLLVAPESVWIPDYGTQQEVVQQTINYVESRPHLDLFYIADCPVGLSVQDMDSFKTGAASPDGTIPAGNALHSSYAAIYYPWITFLNTASNMNVPVPLSGTMAGTYAATDTAVGPWQSAAGVTYGSLGIATGVERKLTTTDQAVLNPDGINCIRSMVNYGIVAYGARTLSTDPSLTYVAVRRLLIEIEVSLYNGLQWVVFEANTPKLWGSVTRDVTEFLTSMWRAGALFGASAAEAFQVQCDAGNNPPDLQAQGQLYVDIKVRPVYPAEFVIIRIQQATLGAS